MRVLHLIGAHQDMISEVLTLHVVGQTSVDLVVDHPHPLLNTVGHRLPEAGLLHLNMVVDHREDHPGAHHPHQEAHPLHLEGHLSIFLVHHADLDQNMAAQEGRPHLLSLVVTGAIHLHLRGLCQSTVPRWVLPGVRHLHPQVVPERRGVTHPGWDPRALPPHLRPGRGEVRSAEPDERPGRSAWVVFVFIQYRSFSLA